MGEHQEHLEQGDVILLELHQLLRVDVEEMQAESLPGKEMDSGEVLHKSKTNIYAITSEQVNKINTLINVLDSTKHYCREKNSKRIIK